MRRPALAALSAIVVSTLVFGATPRLTDEQKRALELKPAVVLIVVAVRVDATWQGEPIPLPNHYLTSAGSGFIYRPDGYIITNGHVVENAKINDPRETERLERQLKKMVYPEVLSALDKYLKSRGAAGLTKKMAQMVIDQGLIGIKYSPSLTVYLANGSHFVGDILQFSPETGEGKDVAVVKIAGQGLPTVALGDSNLVRVQDPVSAIGYPGIASEWGGNELISEESNFVPSVTDGHISAIKKMEKTGTPILQSDVTITHGNSGGPVFNAAGQVIGIATFGAPANAGEGETPGFNFLVPINIAMEFVHAAGVQAQSGPFNAHWAKALDLYSAGECRSSITEFNDALQFVDLPDVRQMESEAVSCYDGEGAMARLMDGSSWALYAAIGLVVLAIGFLILRMRGSAAPAPAPPLMTRVEVTRPEALPSVPAPATSFGNIQGTSGALSGKTFKITKDGLLIGRSSKCQIILPEDTVSNEHAWIVPIDHGVVVIDKGSSNGTYINSTDSPRVSKVGLRNGDRIYIGKKGSSVFTYFSS